jgi:hypothetical protein
MQYRGVALFAVAALVAGCASSSVVETPVIGTDDGSMHEVRDPNGAPVGDGSSAAPSGFRLGSQDRIAGVPEYGTPCDGGTSMPVGLPTVCGTKGRVSIEYAMHSLHAAPPCTLQSVTHGQYSPDSASACVVGDELIVSEACAECRIPDAGWAFHGRISEMTDEQAHDTFQRLGLQGEVPHTAKAWQLAIAKGQPNGPEDVPATAPQPQRAW